MLLLKDLVPVLECFRTETNSFYVQFCKVPFMFKIISVMCFFFFWGGGGGGGGGFGGEGGRCCACSKVL